ncbi:MAG: tetraacyldisaccharide 4'-kinase [Bacteroidetes bacterium]|nr:tetraacyldisaccharide 4'-kinase [Bacteroidota bacterium]
MRKLLWPLSWVYGVAVYLRNMGFGLGLLKQVDFPVPVVVIGNLSAGGTGKSPLVQLLARTLSKEFKVAILSRGYGRSTKGFRMVSKKMLRGSQVMNHCNMCIHLKMLLWRFVKIE